MYTRPLVLLLLRAHMQSKLLAKISSISQAYHIVPAWIIFNMTIAICCLPVYDTDIMKWLCITVVLKCKSGNYNLGLEAWKPLYMRYFVKIRLVHETFCLFFVFL